MPVYTLRKNKIFHRREIAKERSWISIMSKLYTWSESIRSIMFQQHQTRDISKNRDQRTYVYLSHNIFEYIE